jgi:hypothetical protein
MYLKKEDWFLWFTNKIIKQINKSKPKKKYISQNVKLASNSRLFDWPEFSWLEIDWNSKT